MQLFGMVVQQTGECGKSSKLLGVFIMPKAACRIYVHRHLLTLREHRHLLTLREGCFLLSSYVHLVKCIWNNLLNRKFFEFHDAVVKRQHYIDLHELDSLKCGLMVAPKLTEAQTSTQTISVAIGGTGNLVLQNQCLVPNIDAICIEQRLKKNLLNDMVSTFNLMRYMYEEDVTNIPIFQ